MTKAMNGFQMMNELSRREQEVLHLIARDHNSLEIADRLFISRHTVISHRRKLLSKLGVRNMSGAVSRGFELGYLRFDKLAG